MKMTNKVYDIVKKIVMCVLPAISALYCALAGIWGFGYTEQVVGTISAITVFLGALLGISSATYHAQNEETTSFLDA